MRGRKRHVQDSLEPRLRVCEERDNVQEIFLLLLTTVRMGLPVAAALGVKVSNNMEYTRSYVSI